MLGSVRPDGPPCIYRELSTKEKERAVDLVEASRFSEEICNELVTVGSAVETPELVLQSCDRRTLPFLDVLIECELKQVIVVPGQITTFGDSNHDSPFNN